MQLYVDQETWVDANGNPMSEAYLRYSATDAQLVDAFFRGDIRRETIPVPNPQLVELVKCFYYPSDSSFQLIRAVKAIRVMVPGTGLKEAKEFVEEVRELLLRN